MKYDRQPKSVHGVDWMETPMKLGLASAPLSGRLKFSATIGNNLTIGILSGQY